VARPDRTEKFRPAAETTVLIRRAGRGVWGWFTGPRRMTAIGVVLLVAGLVLAGLTMLGSTPTPALASHTATTPKPATTPKRVDHTPTAPPRPADHTPTVAQPDTTDTTLVRLQWGDTLWAMARSHGTTVAALQTLNNMGDSTRIYAGALLRVPARSGVTAQPATAAPAQPAQPGQDQSVDAPTSPTNTDTGPNPVVSVPTQTLDAAMKPATPQPGFQGIFAFSGGNTSDLATDPDVAGRSLVYYWAQLEPQPGVYDWNLVDQDMAPWIAAGKKVILRVTTAGQASWDKTADSAHGTPAWVYAQGVRSVTEKDGAVLPEYWNPTFLADYNDFLRAFAARYDGNPNVALVDAAVGIGGETKPDSENNPNLLSLWQGIGYTDPLWWTTVQQIITDYSTAFTRTPLALMPDKTFLGNTPGYNEARTLNFAVGKGLWLQDNGLLPNRTLPAPWGQTPVVSEQRNPTTTDGNSLAAELQAALADKARIVLVFTTDLTNPADQATIHEYATKTHVIGQPIASPSCPPLPVDHTAIGADTAVSPDTIECPLAATAGKATAPTTPASTAPAAAARTTTAPAAAPTSANTTSGTGRTSDKKHSGGYQAGRKKSRS
jgi:LysM repeat protein